MVNILFAVPVISIRSWEPDNINKYLLNTLVLICIILTILALSGCGREEAEPHYLRDGVVDSGCDRRAGWILASENRYIMVSLMASEK